MTVLSTSKKAAAVGSASTLSALSTSAIAAAASPGELRAALQVGRSRRPAPVRRGAAAPGVPEAVTRASA